MANLPLILLVAAFLLTLGAAFSPWYRQPGGPFLWFPHIGWLGVSLWILSLLVR